jgi:WD40 repeat protein
MNMSNVVPLVVAIVLGSGCCLAEEQPEPQSLKGHKGRVCCVAFSHDGKTIVSGGEDGKVIVWEVDTGKQLYSFDEEGAEVMDVAFSRDGKTVISATFKWEPRLNHSTGRMRWWSQGKDRPAIEKRFTDSLACLDLSSDGKLLATGAGTIYNTDVKVWNAETGEEITTLRGSGDYAYTLKFSPDSKLLAVASGRNRKVVIWDVGKRKTAARCTVLAARSCAFSPDGETLAVGGDDEELTLQDSRDETEQKSLKISPSCEHGLAYLRGGKLLAVAREGRVEVVDVTTGRVIKEKRLIHGGRIRCLAVSPDRAIVATAGDDEIVRLHRLSGDRADK